jgi:transglutaminase-like putative cysteine protease
MAGFIDFPYPYSQSRPGTQSLLLSIMLIRLGYDIEFSVPNPVAVVALLNVHPSRVPDLREPDELRVEPSVKIENYLDHFGNRCARFLAPQGKLRLHNSTLIEDSGLPDRIEAGARQQTVDQLPSEVLVYLLNSRYCEVDRLSNVATDLFGGTQPGWSRVRTITDWVYNKVEFGYHHARATRTALDVYTERVGVCRDFQHLAITFCRCLNVPARYATGYLGDIGVPLSPTAMDFSAWFEVYLDGRWWTVDARHNQPRIGRVLMATGRDASDVAITTSFGRTELIKFTVVTEEVRAAGAN